MNTKLAIALPTKKEQEQELIASFPPLLFMI